MSDLGGAKSAAWAVWFAHAPPEALVARDAAIEKGWDADRWFRPYHGIRGYEPPLGWPGGISTVLSSAWRKTFLSWRPQGASYSWHVGRDGTMRSLWDRARILENIGMRDHPQRFYPQHRALTRIESIETLGVLLLPSLPPLVGYDSWAAVARTAPHLHRFNPDDIPEMPF